MLGHARGKSSHSDFVGGEGSDDDGDLFWNYPYPPSTWIWETPEFAEPVNADKSLCGPDVFSGMGG